MTIAEGTKLGHYQIRSKLGEGGMGEVYLAYDPTLRRDVALKVLHADLLTDKDRVRRFEHEAYAASSLNHPNILTIYSIGLEAGCQFMVTEFVAGATLRQCVRRGPMPLDQVLEIGIQVASALAAAHDAGLIHRDIKPDNIMVRPDHLVKVLDFGLAKLNKPNPVLGSEMVTQSIPITMSGVVMGTARYMSPEQARGLQLDKQTDIWSLGVVLYEMAAGHDPFDAKTLSDIIVAVLTREPPALGQFVAQVPVELERILNKALRKSPEERYQHAREFESDLKSLKRKLDFQIELERSTEPQSGSEAPTSILSTASRADEITIVDSQAVSLATVDPKILAQTSIAKNSETDSQKLFLTQPGDKGKARALLLYLSQLNWKILGPVVAVVVIGATIAAFYIGRPRSVKLTDKDTIVLAEFVNTTGDTVFDGTLRQALASQLGQSPFLSIVGDAQIVKLLALMTKPKDTRLTSAVAREVCKRGTSKATIEGSISGFGPSYELKLKAVDCENGNVLTEVEERANDKQQVIATLSKAVTRLRTQLGESLASLQRFDVPLQNVTTGSLEALRAYSEGHRAMDVAGDYKGAQMLFEQATRLDPNFAMAYRQLAIARQWAGTGSTMDDLRKAYELRGRASERERFAIESTYQMTINQDSEAARQIYETWMQTYPRDDLPAFNLANIYALLGEYEKMLALKQQSLKLDPNNPTSYWGLVTAYLHLNRLDEARATLEEARARKFEAANLHTGLYLIAFLQNDTVTMEQELAYLTKDPRLAKYPLILQTQTAWSKGQLAKVKELLDQSIQNGKEQNKAIVSSDQAIMALTAALIGNPTSAKLEAEEALKTSDDKYAQATAAIVLAVVGESTKAASLADDLEHRFPLNTSLKFHYLPMIRGAAALHNSADRSIEILATSEQYDLGMPPQSGHFPITLFTAYLRGLAHLQARHAELARLNFQKIIDHPGPSRHNPIGPLAHLGIARAYAIAGNAEESKTAYQNFFALWKDADPDIPILKEAKAEYEKLKVTQ